MIHNKFLYIFSILFFIEQYSLCSDTESSTEYSSFSDSEFLNDSDLVEDINEDFFWQICLGNEIDLQQRRKKVDTIVLELFERLKIEKEEMDFLDAVKWAYFIQSTIKESSDLLEKMQREENQKKIQETNRQMAKPVRSIADCNIA